LTLWAKYSLGFCTYCTYTQEIWETSLPRKEEENEIKGKKIRRKIEGEGTDEEGRE
jgi:hypothetical protein